jgi:hypothetical protein
VQTEGGTPRAGEQDKVSVMSCWGQEQDHESEPQHRISQSFVKHAKNFGYFTPSSMMPLKQAHGTIHFLDHPGF